MLNLVENLLENERDPRSRPMNGQDHSLSLSDPDRSLVLIEGLSHFLTNFLQNLLENGRGPMNDQDLTKTDYDPDRSLVLIEGLSHFLTNFLQNLASCQTSLKAV
jgi:adenosyl cobinamide kinase/adenosyl cobinamide phosphate guanylyltransferase